MIQISGGTLKGRKIESLGGTSTRPTLSKVREAVFNILNSRFYFEEYHWIDLFSGSGIISFEAISRGFPNALMVEKHPKATQVIKKNIRQLDLNEACVLYQQDAIQWLNTFYPTLEQSIFYLDPPYESQYIQQILDFIKISENGLGENILVIETDKRINWKYPAQFNLFQSKKYGNSRVDFLQNGNG